MARKKNIAIRSVEAKVQNLTTLNSRKRILATAFTFYYNERLGLVE